MKKSKAHSLTTGVLTFLFIVVSLWFAWEWWQQNPKKEVQGVQTESKRELLSRCLDKAQKDHERNMGDINSAPAPNFTQIANDTFEKDTFICREIYG